MKVIIAEIVTEVNMSCRSQGSMYVCIATLVIDLTKEFYYETLYPYFSLSLLLRNH